MLTSRTRLRPSEADQSETVRCIGTEPYPVAHGIDIAYHVRMLRQRLCGWWKRGSADDFRDTLERYEEQAEAHRQAAEMARSVGSDAGYAHQMQLKDWYEQEAERLRKKLAKRQQH